MLNFKWIVVILLIANSVYSNNTRPSLAQKIPPCAKFTTPNAISVINHSKNREPLQIKTFLALLEERDSEQQRGCCSWHGGVCGCQFNRVVCCDGSYSPSCGC